MKEICEQSLNEIGEQSLNEIGEQTLKENSLVAPASRPATSDQQTVTSDQ